MSFLGTAKLSCLRVEICLADLTATCGSDHTVLAVSLLCSTTLICKLYIGSQVVEDRVKPHTRSFGHVVVGACVT